MKLSCIVKDMVDPNGKAKDYSIRKWAGFASRNKTL